MCEQHSFTWEVKFTMTPPEFIDNVKVLHWAYSGDKPFGVLKYSDGTVATEIFGFAICQYEGKQKVYRFSCDKNWEVEQDSDHDSVEDAMNNIPAQYLGQRIIWKSA